MFDVKAAPNSNDHSLKMMHGFATIGSLTRDGGRVTKATSGLVIAGLSVARVGDVVTYDDGSEAVIINGAGYAAVYGDKPFALVGSELSNGDRIIQSLQIDRGIAEYHHKPIKGLFDSTYVPAPQEPNYRLAGRPRAVVCCANPQGHGKWVSHWGRRPCLRTSSTIRTVQQQKSSADSDLPISANSNLLLLSVANSITETSSQTAPNVKDELRHPASLS